MGSASHSVFLTECFQNTAGCRHFVRLKYISPWTSDETNTPVFKSCTSVPHPSWKTGACKAKEGKQSGRAPRAPLPQAKQGRCCALSLFYITITPASPLALLRSTHTCLNLVAPASTRCPGTASPSLQCLLHPCRHSSVVRLPLHTAHTAHLVLQGHSQSHNWFPASWFRQRTDCQAGAQCPQQPMPLPLSPGCQCDCLHPPSAQKRQEQPKESSQYMATSQAWTLSANTHEANKAGVTPKADLAPLATGEPS